MMLTPLPRHRLAWALAAFAAGLTDPEARRVFRRIAVPAQAARARGAAAATHWRQALALARRFGLGLRPGAPQRGFGWDGRALRTATEAYVLLHEIAHFQLASPERRRQVDFGLGPGPETGDRSGAERRATLFGLEREREEAMTSLLAVLWEVALGHPALASFLDQNWLEGAGRPGASEHFAATLKALRTGGFVTATGYPTRGLRRQSEAKHHLMKLL
ncbi:MAG TPA: hypothetical protein VN802_19035 [Stellaceae bacterium]|nr:hypothetical protein [Stellaceae bacterium]